MTSPLPHDSAEMTLAGTIVTPWEPPFRGVVGIRGEIIVSVARAPEGARAKHHVDVGGSYILPGFVDVHVHSSSLGDEGIAKATVAAAAGGITTMVDMPYDVPAPIDNPGLLAVKAEKVERDAAIDVALLATVPPQNGAAIVSDMLAAGACGIMVSLWEQHSRRYPRIEYAELRKIFHAVAAIDGLLCMHPETDAIIRPLLEEALRASDQKNWRLHASTRPPVSETHGALTGMEFAHEAGARIHLHQLSTARSFEIIKWYREQGTSVTGETIIHHLLFEEEDLATHGGRIKINPPLRSAENREALWRQLAAGSVAIVASDHSPWGLCQKTKPEVLQNESGMPGLETFPSILLSTAHARNIPLSRVAQVAAYTPARTFGLGGRKGDIRPGLDADLIVFDPKLNWEVDRRALKTSAGWDPYEGCSIGGRVTMTMARGRVVWDGARVLALPGWGQWLRSAPARCRSNKEGS